jgi:hypothetical protein
MGIRKTSSNLKSPTEICANNVRHPDEWMQKLMSEKVAKKEFKRIGGRRN